MRSKTKQPDRKAEHVRSDKPTKQELKQMRRSGLNPARYDDIV